MLFGTEILVPGKISRSQRNKRIEIAYETEKKLEKREDADDDLIKVNDFFSCLKRKEVFPVLKMK